MLLSLSLIKFQSSNLNVNQKCLKKSPQLAIFVSHLKMFYEPVKDIYSYNLPLCLNELLLNFINFQYLCKKNVQEKIPKIPDFCMKIPFFLNKRNKKNVKMKTARKIYLEPVATSVSRCLFFIKYQVVTSFVFALN